jgi:hypothetical protein
VPTRCVCLQGDGARRMGAGGLRVELDAELAGAVVDRTTEQMLHALALARVRWWIFERPHMPLGLVHRKSDARRCVITAFLRSQDSAVRG